MSDIKYSPMQVVKRHFFAMRNGVIADTLRKAGSPFRIIFGLNLPQIVEIAASVGQNQELAEALWANATTRESMLLAPMIADRATFTRQDTLRWIESIPAAEVADILCHRLLRHMPYARELSGSLLKDGDTHWARYTGLRLAFNLVYADPEASLAAARIAMSDQTLAPIARALEEEARLIAGS